MIDNSMESDKIVEETFHALGREQVVKNRAEIKRNCRILAGTFGTMGAFVVVALVTTIALAVLYKMGNGHVTHMVDQKFLPFINTTLPHGFHQALNWVLTHKTVSIGIGAAIGAVIGSRYLIGGGIMLAYKTKQNENT